MRKKTLRIILITISILLAFFVAAGLFVCQQSIMPRPPEPPPEIVEPTPEPTPEDIEVVGLRVLLENEEIIVGTRFWPEVIIQPYNATDKSYELRSDNELVVRKQGNNWVAAGIGKANLIATTANGITASVEVTVTSPELQSMSFPYEEITMQLEDQIDAILELAPRGVNVDGHIKYTSANERVATVSSEGRITAVGIGNTTITAMVGSITADLKVTVVVPVRSIQVIMERRIYSLGEQAEFRIQLEPENASNASVAVSFSGAQVTSIGPNTFTCDEAGEVKITFTAESGSSTEITIVVHDLVVLAEDVFRLTNLERINAGRSALGRLTALSEVAQLRAGEIIIRLDQDHRRPDGREFFTILDDYGVERMFEGENLAAGQRSPADVVREWMESPGHRRNIVNEDFTYLGVGVTMDHTGRIYWVQLFID